VLRGFVASWLRGFGASWLFCCFPMHAIAIIPARLASTRLPRKVLREIAGRPMLAHVVEAAQRCPELADVIVATDSDEVLAVCKQNGWHAQMTSASHRSGTDRVWEVAQRIPADVYVNVQGDEPLARPEHISALLALMKDPRVLVSTLKTPIPCGAGSLACGGNSNTAEGGCATDIAGDAADINNPNAVGINNPNTVKVVADLDGRALYFTRATVPFDRDNTGSVARFKHLGFYAYRREVLEKFCAWPESELERAERLEQLRFLDHGIAIHVAETPYDTVGVDTEEDLKRVEEMLRGR
jgi:3-deoxy-manno-octulosonate cytidylyltransferase (CMP-KDO synthetase)